MYIYLFIDLRFSPPRSQIFCAPSYRLIAPRSGICREPALPPPFFPARLAVPSLLLPLRSFSSILLLRPFTSPHDWLFLRRYHV